MALPPSTANWHWKQKNVTPWCKTWLERELITLSVNGSGSEVVQIVEVTEVEGDAELGQRKSKLITIYDLKVVLKWTGTASDGTDVDGTLTIPEVSHEITLDGLNEYSFEWRLNTTSSSAVDGLYSLARKNLTTALETKLAELPSAMISAHGRDLQVATPDDSRTGTPAPGATSSTTAAATPKVEEKKPANAKIVNTETVSVEATFQASADDLFNLFTDEKRIPLWSRAPAQSKPEVNSEFSLFGGGVKGTYTSLTPPSSIVQSWALQSPSWPSGHYGTLTISINQESDSTKVKFSLAGVPKGTEDEIKRNIEGYYVGGLKSIGLGSQL